MKIISKEEKDAHFRETLRGGAIGGSIGLSVGLAGLYAASKRYSAVRSLTLPFRTFLVTSVGVFGLITTAERYSIAFGKAQEASNFYRDEAQRAVDRARRQESRSQKLLTWARENRYTVVAGSWVVSMAVALAIVGRNKYWSNAQKLVQARVYAQALTVAVMIAAAALETSDAKSGTGRWETVMVADPDDPTHQHMIEKHVHKEDYQGQDLWKGEYRPD